MNTTESTYLDMTVDHLGPAATEDDLRDFREACERVMRSTEFDGSPDLATDYVWNNGAIRFEADTCIYCNRAVANRTIIPARDDDEAWEDLAAEHEDDCEWIATRAHRLTGNRS